MLEEIGFRRLKESLERFPCSEENEQILTISEMLLISLSLRNTTYARLAMALATLIVGNRICKRYMDELDLFENPYGRNELMGKLFIYS